MLGEKLCEGCGKSYSPGHAAQKYHSHECYLTSMLNLEKLRSQAQRAGVKGGMVTGSQKRGRGTGYAKVTGADVHEHRAVAEAVLGRSLEAGEIVHHEDRNKRNNDPTNLIVFPSQAVHARHHGLKHCLKPCSCPGIRLGEVMPSGAP